MLHYVCRADESIINPAFGRGFLFWLNYERLKYFLVKVLHILVWVVIISTMEQEQNTPQTDQNLTADLNKKRSFRFWYALLAILVIGGIGYYISSTNNSGDPTTPEETIVQQNQEFQQRVEELPADTTKEERYNYYVRIARGFYLQNQYDDTIEWLNKFPEEDKNYQGVWYHYALAYQGLENNEQALGSIKKAVEATPDNPQPWELYFELIKDIPREQQDAIYKEALAKTENDPKITAAYQAWQSSQQ